MDRLAKTIVITTGVNVALKEPLLLEDYALSFAVDLVVQDEFIAEIVSRGIKKWVMPYLADHIQSWKQKKGAI